MFVFRLKRCWDRGVLVEARPRLDRDRASWVIHWSNVTVGASLVAQQKRIHLLMQEIWVWSLGWEDPLKKEMATHSSILAWEIPRIEEPGRLQSMGLQRFRHDLATKTTMEPWSRAGPPCSSSRNMTACGRAVGLDSQLILEKLTGDCCKVGGSSRLPNCRTAQVVSVSTLLCRDQTESQL